MKNLQIVVLLCETVLLIFLLFVWCFVGFVYLFWGKMGLFNNFKNSVYIDLVLDK